MRSEVGSYSLVYLKFKSSARQVILMANKNAMNVFVSFETLAAVYPSTAKATNATLPFVTIDNFDTLAGGVRNISKASYINFKALLHTMEDVEKWNAYTAQNKHWIAEARKFQVYGPDDVVSDDFPPFVFWSDTSDDPPVPANSSGLPFAVNWQISPVPPELDRVNFDVNYRPNNKAATAYVEATGKYSLTEPNDKL
jgi:hypothetical protein